MPDPRVFFVAKPTERGRHQSFNQPMAGEYAFRLYQGSMEGQARLQSYNDATAALQEMIADAVRDDGALRARGSLWSLSKAAVTDGRLIDTTALRHGFDFPEVLIDPGYAGDFRHLRFIECGASIDAVNRYLFTDRLSLKASGSNNGQTLAGALSTGTHGGAFNVGAFPECVVGLHLVTGPGKQVYLERGSYPVMRQGFADSLGAEFRRNDDLFNAALVSFGSFGVIHGVMVEARELFVLNAIRFTHPYNDGLKRAIETLDLSGLRLPGTADAVPKHTPYHFEVFFNPNEGAPPDEGFVLVMYEDDWTETYEPPEWEAHGAGMGASGLDIMGALVDRIPSPLNRIMIPILNGQVRDEFAPYIRKGIIRDLFRGEKTLGKTMASGMGMPLSRTLEALDIAYAAYHEDDDVLPVILSFRFVKGTQATLGFTRFDPTAVFEIDAVNTPKTRQYLNRVWARMDAAGIPFTLHWGKFNGFLTPARVRNRYGDAAVDSWIAAREALLENADVRRVFANAFITRLGLAT